MTVLSLLTPNAESGYDNGWFGVVEESLRMQSDEWAAEVMAVGELGQDEAWQLLGWVEMAASRVVQTKSQDTLVTAAFGLSLALRSELDERDCLVVGSLLRRAASLSALDYAGAIHEGCGRSGFPDGEVETLLLAVSDRTPPTHEESGTGASFTFTRRPVDFDVDDLERLLGEQDQ